MALLDWILVAFGAVVALAGGWIQLHPERLVPSQSGPRQNPDWQFEAGALAQIRLLGTSILCMGAFFTIQMSIDLVHLPWWMGTLGGIATAIFAVLMIGIRVRRQQRQRRCSIQQSRLPRKALELR
jgi:hypothetical protein